MSPRITDADLAALGACEDQRERFRAAFPRGLTVSRRTIARNAAKVTAAGLDADWYAQRALSDDERDAYAQATAAAEAAYEQATEPAWAAYMQATAPALALYAQATAPALATYEQATATAVLTILCDREQA